MADYKVCSPIEDEPDLRKLNSEMRQQNKLGALPLLPCGRDFLLRMVSQCHGQTCHFWQTYILNLVLVEVWDSINDHPRERASEIDDLVHNEGHDPRCQNIVLHESIPCGPKLL